MELIFTGDLTWWQGAALSAVFVWAAWVLYRRETGRIKRPFLRTFLPILRCCAAAALLFCLTGPVLRYRYLEGELGRVVVLVDGSKSMGLEDENMEEKRKRAALAAEGVLTGGENEDEIRRAVQLFDASSRWTRAGRLLFDPERGVVPKLTGTHEIEIAVLEGKKVRPVWRSEGGRVPVPDALPGEPSCAVTNLADGLKALLGGDVKRTAVVLLSDGRHNDGSSPLKAAGEAGGRGVPIYAVGLGDVREPPDLAITEVEGPESVYPDDRVKGTAVVYDSMPPGTSFSVTVSCEGRELWRREFKSSGVGLRNGLRKIEFDFPVTEAAKGKVGADSHGVEIMARPLAFVVRVEPVAGEAERENNSAKLWTRLVTHGKKVLLLDGRPRWEARFLRNLFDRLKRWKIDALFSVENSDGRIGFTGDGRKSFPEDRETLYSYGLIVFGDVPRRAFKEKELEWIRGFVEKRGAAVIFIDGARSHLKEYAGTPLSPLFPVERVIRKKDAGMPLGLLLTPAGRLRTAFRLEKDPGGNSRLWTYLPAPHWTSPVRALEGTETFVEVRLPGGTTSPAVVGRRFGAGRVLYLAFDSTWRWRYEVADKYHERFWLQTARWLMEPPYAARDKYVSIDAGGPLYRTGEKALIRVRLRDRAGKPLSGAEARAVVFRDGRKVAVIPLEGDPAGGGSYRATTPELEPGSYEVGVSVEGFSELELRARASFEVEPRKEKEYAVLSCNETLLKRMAQLSGGIYLREEEAGSLPGLLAPLSEGRVVVTETRLAQSYWWFIPFVLLLTVEWILRKRLGLL